MEILAQHETEHTKIEIAHEASKEKPYAVRTYIRAFGNWGQIGLWSFATHEEATAKCGRINASAETFYNKDGTARKEPSAGALQSTHTMNPVRFREVWE